VLTRLLMLLAAYLFGSIPVSFLIARAVAGKDLRQVGSGNTGATNVYRVAGAGWALLAFLGDALKGVLPVWAALHLLSRFSTADLVWVAGAGLLAVLGHLFPPWLKFRGGKGVATSFGVMLVLAPGPALLALVLWAAMTFAFKLVSAASLVAALALPVLVYFFKAGPAKTWLALALCLLIFISHHENLGRLIRGEEKPIRRSSPEEKL
jgi:glycerol-3-phosphate acyltransferase PlsY